MSFSRSPSQKAKELGSEPSSIPPSSELAPWSHLLRRARRAFQSPMTAGAHGTYQINRWSRLALTSKFHHRVRSPLGGSCGFWDPRCGPFFRSEQTAQARSLLTRPRQRVTAGSIVELRELGYFVAITALLAAVAMLSLVRHSTPKIAFPHDPALSSRRLNHPEEHSHFEGATQKA